MKKGKWCTCNTAETTGICPKCGGNFLTNNELPKKGTGQKELDWKTK
ncbi:MAG: hypothetical protein ACYDG6_02730 [Thermincolia bacterium]